MNGAAQSWISEADVSESVERKRTSSFVLTGITDADATDISGFTEVTALTTSVSDDDRRHMESLISVAGRSTHVPKSGTACCDYYAVLEGELDISRGDEVTVLACEGAYWRGRIGDREGTFPHTVINNVAYETMDDAQVDIAPVSSPSKTRRPRRTKGESSTRTKKPSSFCDDSILTVNGSVRSTSTSDTMEDSQLTDMAQELKRAEAARIKAEEKSRQQLEEFNRKLEAQMKDSSDDMETQRQLKELNQKLEDQARNTARMRDEEEARKEVARRVEAARIEAARLAAEEKAQAQMQEFEDSARLRLEAEMATRMDNEFARVKQLEAALEAKLAKNHRKDEKADAKNEDRIKERVAELSAKLEAEMQRKLDEEKLRANTEHKELAAKLNAQEKEIEAKRSKEEAMQQELKELGEKLNEQSEKKVKKEKKKVRKDPQTQEPPDPAQGREPQAPGRPRAAQVEYFEAHVAEDDNETFLEVNGGTDRIVIDHLETLFTQSEENSQSGVWLVPSNFHEGVAVHIPSNRRPSREPLLAHTAAMYDGLRTADRSGMNGIASTIQKCSAITKWLTCNEIWLGRLLTQAQRAVVLRSYRASKRRDLAITEGTIIRVLESPEEDEMWYGCFEKNEGFFPKSCVRLLHSDEVAMFLEQKQAYCDFQINKAADKEAMATDAQRSCEGLKQHLKFANSTLKSSSAVVMRRETVMLMLRNRWWMTSLVLSWRINVLLQGSNSVEKQLRLQGAEHRKQLSAQMNQLKLAEAAYQQKLIDEKVQYAQAISQAAANADEFLDNARSEWNESLHKAHLKIAELQTQLRVKEEASQQNVSVPNTKYAELELNLAESQARVAKLESELAEQRQKNESHSRMAKQSEGSVERELKHQISLQRADMNAKLSQRGREITELEHDLGMLRLTYREDIAALREENTRLVNQINIGLGVEPDQPVKSRTQTIAAKRNTGEDTMARANSVKRGLGNMSGVMSAEDTHMLLMARQKFGH